MRGEMQLTYKTISLDVEASDTNDNVKTKIQSNINTKNMKPNNDVTHLGYEPNVIDTYHISETTDIFIQESSSESRPANLHDSEIDDYTVGKVLSSPLFTHKREDPASCRQVYHSPDESLGN